MLSFFLFKNYSIDWSINLDESPNTNSDKEYDMPFIKWQLFPVTSENAKILPSQGDEIWLGFYYDN